MPQQNNTLGHLLSKYDRKGKKVSPIILPKDLTPEAVTYLGTFSTYRNPYRAQVRGYLKAWVNARSANASFEEAHIQGRAAVKRANDLSNAQHLVRTFRQAGIKFQK